MALIVIDVLTVAERQAVEEHLHVGERADRHADPADLALGLRARRSRSPSASAGRRRPTGRSGPARAGSGSGGWCPRRVAKPAYWRIVQSRPRYIVGWTPRVNGNSPGRPRSRSSSRPARSAGVYRSADLDVAELVRNAVRALGAGLSAAARVVARHGRGPASRTCSTAELTG